MGENEIWKGEFERMIGDLIWIVDQGLGLVGD